MHTVVVATVFCWIDKYFIGRDMNFEFKMNI